MSIGTSCRSSDLHASVTAMLGVVLTSSLLWVVDVGVATSWSSFIKDWMGDDDRRESVSEIL